MTSKAAKKERPSPPASPPISMLPEDMLMACMEYAGKGNYLFIATVSKEFNACYAKVYPDRETIPGGFASDSLECAKMCIASENDNFKLNVFRWAAMKGHSGIVEHCINHCSIPQDILKKVDCCAIGRHWEVVKLLQKHSFGVNWNFCCYGAAKAKNKELVM